jgi:hypothetical protein
MGQNYPARFEGNGYAWSVLRSRTTRFRPLWGLWVSLRTAERSLPPVAVLARQSRGIYAGKGNQAGAALPTPPPGERSRFVAPVALHTLASKWASRRMPRLATVTPADSRRAAMRARPANARPATCPTAHPPRVPPRTRRPAIHKGRLGEPVGFGHKAQAVDNEDATVVDHAVFIGNPPDASMFTPAIQRCPRRGHRRPRLWRNGLSANPSANSTLARWWWRSLLVCHATDYRLGSRPDAVCEPADQLPDRQFAIGACWLLQSQLNQLRGTTMPMSATATSKTLTSGPSARLLWSPHSRLESAITPAGPSTEDAERSYGVSPTRRSGVVRERLIPWTKSCQVE